MNKNSNYLINLLFIYLAMVLMIGISLYALIKLFDIDTSLSANLLIWSATLFPSVVIIYTFQSWRNQKASEILAIEAKTLAEMMRDQQELHRIIITSHTFDKKFESALIKIKDEFDVLSRKLNFLESIISNVYGTNDLNLFIEKKNQYQRCFHRYWEGNKTVNLAHTYEGSWVQELNIDQLDKHIPQINEEASNAHLDMYEILIKIMLHSESLSSKH